MKHKGAKKTKIVTEETTDGLARDETNSTTDERERERERESDMSQCVMGAFSKERKRV